MPKIDTTFAPCEPTQVASYQEFCKDYRAIQDFRAKTLALLPVASRQRLC